MMNDASSDDARSMAARLTNAGEAIGERVQGATTATAAATGRAKKALEDAGEAAQQAWLQAGGVVEDVVGADRLADQIRFAADRRESIARSSGRLRARLRRGLVDSRTTADQEESQMIRRMEPHRRSGWT
jgi:hypothetical protein